MKLFVYFISDLAEQFTNCTLMCYLPPYSGKYKLIRRCAIMLTELT